MTPTHPGLLVGGEGSSAVRTWELGLGGGHGHHGRVAWSFYSAPFRCKRFLFAFLSSVFSISSLPL